MKVLALLSLLMCANAFAAQTLDCTMILRDKNSNVLKDVQKTSGTISTNLGVLSSVRIVESELQKGYSADISSQDEVVKMYLHTPAGLVIAEGSDRLFYEASTKKGSVLVHCRLKN